MRIALGGTWGLLRIASAQRSFGIVQAFAAGIANVMPLALRSLETQGNLAAVRAGFVQNGNVTIHWTDVIDATRRAFGSTLGGVGELCRWRAGMRAAGRMASAYKEVTST